MAGGNREASRWDTEDMPMPGGSGVHRFFRQGGRDVAAAGSMPPQMADQGIPSHRNVWVAGDADEVVERAAAAGGQLLMPFDENQRFHGRGAVLADPSGGHFSVVTTTQPPAG